MNGDMHGDVLSGCCCVELAWYDVGALAGPSSLPPVTEAYGLLNTKYNGHSANQSDVDQAVKAVFYFPDDLVDPPLESGEIVGDYASYGTLHYVWGYQRSRVTTDDKDFRHSRISVDGSNETTSSWAEIDNTGFFVPGPSWSWSPVFTTQNSAISLFLDVPVLSSHLAFESGGSVYGPVVIALPEPKFVKAYADPTATHSSGDPLEGSASWVTGLNADGSVTVLSAGASIVDIYWETGHAYDNAATLQSDWVTAYNNCPFNDNDLPFGATPNGWLGSNPYQHENSAADADEYPKYLDGGTFRIAYFGTRVVSDKVCGVRMDSTFSYATNGGIYDENSLGWPRNYQDYDVTGTYTVAVEAGEAVSTSDLSYTPIHQICSKAYVRDAAVSIGAWVQPCPPLSGNFWETGIETPSDRYFHKQASYDGPAPRVQGFDVRGAKSVAGVVWTDYVDFADLSSRDAEGTGVFINGTKVIDARPAFEVATITGTLRGDLLSELRDHYGISSGNLSLSDYNDLVANWPPPFSAWPQTYSGATAGAQYSFYTTPSESPVWYAGGLYFTDSNAASDGFAGFYDAICLEPHPDRPDDPNVAVLVLEYSAEPGIVAGVRNLHNVRRARLLLYRDDVLVRSIPSINLTGGASVNINSFSGKPSLGSATRGCFYVNMPFFNNSQFGHCVQNDGKKAFECNGEQFSILSPWQHLTHSMGEGTQVQYDLGGGLVSTLRGGIPTPQTPSGEYLDWTYPPDGEFDIDLPYVDA